ncbi:MAG: DNA polymerase IV [Lachnospiraceae bacterium]|nr:DNA polymerase IV [Lachnospiraceae bacterium]
MERLIFHVDVNSAFLSWESKRRVENGLSDLRQIPSCIGGDPETRRGIVLAKSIPAKRYGIKTGEPLSMALRKCPALTIAPPDFKLYAACSKAFKDMCREYAPVVEEFSIDECFLDFTGTEYIYPDPLALAYKIKDRIRDELGFTVNIGIGRNKLCAKMAGDFEKPDKVHTLFMEEVPLKMWPLPVEDLLYVGAASAGKLKAVSIYTIGDLAHADRNLLKRLLGEKFSEQAYLYANGLDDSEVRKEPEEAKGYSNSVTLEQDVTDLETAHAILLALADSVTAHMRNDQAKSTCISVTIRYLDFKNRSHQCKLEEPVNTTTEVYETAKNLLAELWKDQKPLRLMGISLTGLVKGEYAKQMSLFGQEKEKKRERDEKLDQTVDLLRNRFGYDIIKRGTVMAGKTEVAKKFKGKQEAKKQGEFTQSS